MRKAGVARSGPSNLTVNFEVLPGWSVLVAILFFPLGLLALLARRTESAVVIASPEGSNTRLRLSGPFSRVAVDRINAVITVRS